MANELALVTANTVRIVGIPISQATGPADESITAGQAARINPTGGKYTKSNASTTTENRVFGLATRTPEAIGIGVTFLRKGYLDGFDLSALAYDAPVYLSDTDGAISGTAGTTTIVVGRVVSGFAAGLNSPDKLLFVDL